MLYQPTAEQVQAFVRGARKVERLLQRRGGSLVDPIFALAKVNEVIAAAEPIRFTDELILRIPALPRPTIEELQGKFPWIRSVERDTSPTEAITLRLGTVLRGGEGTIGGGEYERRLAPKQDILLGYQQAVWLLESQDQLPELMAMAILGKVYIDLPGLVVAGAGGLRSLPYLRRDGGRWRLRWNWLGYGFSSDGRIAVSSK